MSAHSTAAGRGSSGPLPPVLMQILKLIGLAVIDAFALLIIYSFWNFDQLGLVLTIAAITLFVNVVVLAPQLYPLRWMSPGLVMMILMVIYPIIFTLLIAFTNYSDGHLFAKDQSIALHESKIYVPEDAPIYNFVPFVNDDSGELGLWLTNEPDDGPAEILWAELEGPLQIIEADDVAAPTGSEAPAEYQGFRPMERRELVQFLSVLETGEFGEGAATISVTSASRGTASRTESRFVYDAEQDGLYDQRDDIFYAADNETGSWITTNQTVDNPQLDPGYQVTVGLDNFMRFLTDESLRGPLVTVFIWTVLFAFLSVFTTFVLGLFMALILNEKSIPYRKALRSTLIIPYAVPAIISILTWRGMMNPNLGVLANVFGIHVEWFSTAFWSRFGIVLINLWLGYPYMMLITSGALQGIPGDIYEAAEVDGAGSRQRFWNITLPLLLVAVGPLLIASFTFNFNNFVVIEAFNEGGPPIPGTLTPAGYTDILISYTYRLAFGSGRGADYGLASAITIVIFAIVAGITLVNFRFTGQWEEVSENV